MVLRQQKSDARKDGQQYLNSGNLPPGITKHQLRPTTFKQLPDPGCIKPLRRSPRLLELKKRTLNKVNEEEEHRQLPSPSISNSPKISSESKRKRPVSLKPPLEETNSRHSKRRKTSSQTPHPEQFQETVPKVSCAISERLEGAPEAVERGEKDEDGGEKDIEGGEKDIEGGEKDIARGEKDIARGEKDIESGEKDKAREEKNVEGGEKDIEGGEKDIEGGEKDIEGGEKDIEGGEKDIEGGEKDIEGGEKDIEGGEKDIEGGEKGIEDREKDIERGEKDIERGEKDIEREKKNIERGEKDIERGEKDIEDPISHWAANHTWPDNFSDPRAMLRHIAKRQRMSDQSPSGKDEKTRSYSQSRKDGDAPGQYTKSYAKYIFTNGLDMDDFKGAKFVSPDSKEYCKVLQNQNCMAISPTVYTMVETLQVINLCRNRNEAMVNRDITPLIVPPIKSFYLKDGVHLEDGVNPFEHLTDEVNAQWHDSWVLAGPRPKPDLTVGFLSSAFSVAENRKLTEYTSFENLTRPTEDLSFPFLMCEVKCGNEALDYADRQNMHSCSVAVKALLKIEQKADQYREDKQFEKLLGKILVYSISHDHTDARLYGYYALVEGEGWTFYRHYIRHFDIAHEESDLLALYNFARNVITIHAPELLKRLRKAIAMLPVSSILSCSADSMNLEDPSQQSSQQPLGFATSGLPANTQKILDAQREQMDKLLQHMELQKEQKDQKDQQTKQQIEQMERQLNLQKEQMERQMELQLQLQKEQKEQMEQQNKQQMEHMNRQMEEMRNEKRELLDLLMQKLK